MLTTAAAMLMALSALAPVEQTDDADASAPPVQVEVVTVNGSGCRAGTADATTDGRTFNVDYHFFLAQAGGGASPVDFRKNCQLSLRVSVPAGYRYGLARTATSGFAHLESGASAIVRTSYYFQGSSQTEFVQRSFTGPFSDEYTASHRPGQIIWSTCGESRLLNVNYELRINIGTADRDKRNFLMAANSRGAVRARPC